MKFSSYLAALAALSASAGAFQVTSSFTPKARSNSSLSMVLEKPKVKMISKLEQLKVESDHLVHPLKEVG
jgi:hypothetical protein